MKNKFKKSLRAFVLLTGILLFSISCHEDDNIITEEGNGNHNLSHKSNIDFTTFLERFGSTANPALSRKSKLFSLDNYQFGRNTNNILNRDNGESIIQYIDTTDIVAFNFDYVQTYTFNVVPTIDTQNTFYNIIFYQNSEGAQSKLLKYESDFDYVNSTDVPFSGVIHDIEEDETILNTYYALQDSTNSNLANRTATECAFSISYGSQNCSGDNHAPGNDECKCGHTVDCTPAFEYPVLDLICITTTTGSGGNPDETNPDDGNPTGTTATDNPNQNEDGTFNLPTDTVKGERANWNSFFNGLSLDSQILLNTSTLIRTQIQNFLTANYYSTYSVNFMSSLAAISNENSINEVFQFLIDNPTSQGLAEAELMVLEKYVNNPTDPKWDETQTGVYENNPALAYDAKYIVPGSSGTEIMYRLLDHDLTFLVSPSPKLINNNTPASIAPTDSPLEGAYYYIHDSTSNRWYEYGLPVEVSANVSCTSCDLENMWDAFVNESLVIAGRYFLPVEDVIVLITGEDFDGAKSSRAVAGGFILVDLIPGAKVAKLIKIGKYGDEALELAALAVKKIDDIYKAQKAVIDQYKGIISQMSNARKGNFGEIAADVDLLSNGYERLHNSPLLDIDANGHPGIDHVYKNPTTGEFLLVEAKWGNNGLNGANPNTGLPRQMSDDWITDESLSTTDRLFQAIGENTSLYQEIMSSGYTRLKASVQPDGSVTYRLIGSDGYQINGAIGIYNL